MPNNSSDGIGGDDDSGSSDSESEEELPTITKQKSVWVDPNANWADGDDVTEEDKVFLMTLGSNYERVRALGIRRRQCLEAKTGLRERPVDTLFMIAGPRNPPGPAAAPPIPRKAKKNPTVNPTRRSE